MKKFAVILGFITTGLLLGSCEKQNLSVANSTSDYYLTKKGEKQLNIRATIYQIPVDEPGQCPGSFLKPIDLELPYLIEITGGVPDSVLYSSEVSEMEYLIDISFLGESYNCNQTFKKPTSGNSSPIEIQQVVVTRIEVN